MLCTILKATADWFVAGVQISVEEFKEHYMKHLGEFKHLGCADEVVTQAANKETSRKSPRMPPLPEVNIFTHPEMQKLKDQVRVLEAQLGEVTRKRSQSLESLDALLASSDEEAASDGEDAPPPNTGASARTEQQTDAHTARDRARSLVVPAVAMASSPRDRAQTQGEASAMLEQAFEAAAQAKLAREAEECPVREASPEVRGSGWRDRLSVGHSNSSQLPFSVVLEGSQNNSPRNSPRMSPRQSK